VAFPPVPGFYQRHARQTYAVRHLAEHDFKADAANPEPGGQFAAAAKSGNMAASRLSSKPWRSAHRHAFPRQDQLAAITRGRLSATDNADHAR
jgi:hypothetical protein